MFFEGKKKLSKIRSHTATFGKFLDGNQLLDEVIITVFRSPHSYTGEDVVEISCHGNMYIVNRILETLLTKCRLAGKGEFTQRAFMNNRSSSTLRIPSTSFKVLSSLSLLINPKPFALLVAFAGAASFITPIGYQTNLMVYGPGGYSFKDFFRIGLPMTILFMVVAVLGLTLQFGLKIN